MKSVHLPRRRRRPPRATHNARVAVVRAESSSPRARRIFRSVTVRRRICLRIGGAIFDFSIGDSLSSTINRRTGARVYVWSLCTRARACICICRTTTPAFGRTCPRLYERSASIARARPPAGDGKERRQSHEVSGRLPALSAREEKVAGPLHAVGNRDVHSHGGYRGVFAMVSSLHRAPSAVPLRSHGREEERGEVARRQADTQSTPRVVLLRMSAALRDRSVSEDERGRA